MSYDSYQITNMDELTPDGSTESPNILDDAIREIKRCIIRAGIHKVLSVTSETQGGYRHDGVVKIDTTDNDVNYTLHTASSPKLQIVTWGAGSNTAKISPNSSDTIAGSSSEITFSTIGETYILFSDGGTNWIIVGKYFEGMEVGEQAVLSIRETVASGITNNKTERTMDDYGVSINDKYFLRTFNQVDLNNISGASISTTTELNDTITLPVGKYHITGWSMCSSYRHRLALQEIADPLEESTLVGYGSYLDTLAVEKLTLASQVDFVLNVSGSSKTYRFVHLYLDAISDSEGGRMYAFGDSYYYPHTFCSITFRKITL